MQYNEKLYIFDGANMYVYNGTAFVYETAYVPTILIGRSPTGGGTLYEEVNLLGDWMKVLFYGTASATVYYLPYTNIMYFGAGELTVEKNG